MQFDILYEKKVEVIEENLFDDDLHCFHEKKGIQNFHPFFFFPISEIFSLGKEICINFEES